MLTYHERYAARLRAFVQAWPGKTLADYCYLAGRSARAQGRARGWNYAGVLKYPGQRLARLGYVDEARGLPNRVRVENWDLSDY
jgi:hypothetical protein